MLHSHNWKWSLVISHYWNYSLRTVQARSGNHSLNMVMNSDKSRKTLMKQRAITVHGDRSPTESPARARVLLVHGLAGSAMTWRHVIAPLARRFTVIAPDLLGQGESDKPRAEYSLGAHVDTLRDLLDALGHERATLVGQSLGGGVAMQFAYQFPERCELLVLVNSGGLGREVTFYLRMLTVPGFESVFPLFCTPRLRDAGNRVATWLGRAGVRSTPASQEIWRSYASLADAENRRAFFRSLHDVIDFSGQAVSALGRLYRAARLPTLIVWGARDPFLPMRHAVAAHKAIPGSRLEIFDGVGHYPHCEAPERFVAVLVDFIASTKPARLSARSAGRRVAPTERLTENLPRWIARASARGPCLRTKVTSMLTMLPIFRARSAPAPPTRTLLRALVRAGVPVPSPLRISSDIALISNLRYRHRRSLGRTSIA
jgi:pimeloyl-ACP methyl ester carboxylesterase